MPKPRDGILTVREITAPDDVALRPAYALLRKTFPPTERVPIHEWRDTLREREAGLWTDLAWHLFVAERNGKVLGLASGTYVGNVNLGVIGYLAASPEARGLGTGTRLRVHLRAAFQRDAKRLTGESLAGILGEVSKTNPWLAHLSRNPRVLILDLEYFQPRLYPSDEPSPFVLYYESTDGPRRSIPVSELKRILYAVWRRVYRVRRPLERPAFRAMLRSLQGRRTVGRRPLTARRRGK
ncbi:MAG TPA: GNAT family N-acetyltransferase [Gemmatimonadaceae bacterium]